MTSSRAFQLHDRQVLPVAVVFNFECGLIARLSARQLRAEYAETFGEETNAHNKVWLIKRIAWRMQSQLEGDISQRARLRATELANDADLRRSPPKNQLKPEFNSSPDSTHRPAVDGQHDDRLPPPGGIIVKAYKNKQLQIRVLAEGFEFEGHVYRSLSAIAKQVTGQHINGFKFFKLERSTTTTKKADHERS